METPTVLYNPFLQNDRIHFPSFMEAFGDLLKIEEENVRKISLQKAKEMEQKNQENKFKPTLKKPSNSPSNSNSTSPPNQSNSNSNELNPIIENTPLQPINLNISGKSQIHNCNTSTPIPLTKKKFIFSNSNQKNKTNSLSIPSNNSFSNLPITPIPTKSHKKITFTNNNINNNIKNNKLHTNGMSYDVLTPIPCKSKNKTENMSINNKRINDYSMVTPMPCKIKKKKKTKIAPEPAPDTLDIIVTPAPKIKKEKSFKSLIQLEHTSNNTSSKDTSKHTSKDTSNDASDDESEKSVIMLKDIMSPIPANRYELRSPAANDKNARILTRTPAKFPIIMPPTPMLHGSKKRIESEEKKNVKFFANHIPTVTPIKLRENPIKLYNPSEDVNASQLLLNMTVPFDSIEDDDPDSCEVNAMQQLQCDISMIPPVANNKMNNSMGGLRLSSIFGQSVLDMNDQTQIIDKTICHDQSEVKEDLNVTSPFTPVKSNNNNNVKSQNSTGNNSNITPDISSMDEQFSAIKLALNSFVGHHLRSFEKSMSSSANSFSESTKGKGKFLSKSTIGRSSYYYDGCDQFDDDSFLGVEPLSDREFFCRTGVEDQSTQTNPVLIFHEHEIPKITYNGKLINNNNCVMSMSAIYYKDEINMSNHSVQSTQSENNANKIIYNDMYTPVLRLNNHSIKCENDMINNGYSDSENDDKSNLCNQRNNIRNIKKESGDKMLRKYKQSKLAQNPNWSISGDLVV